MPPPRKLPALAGSGAGVEAAYQRRLREDAEFTGRARSFGYEN